ncbi:MAG: glycosyltransferase family 4 protein [Phycisphaerales bacterium]|jgi:glycosyltransferase involved in cell wall biosynthesis
MKIAQITPSAGDSFYCENCLRDLALVKAIRKSGHDITMIPLYLPPPVDESNLANKSPIFFGGINVYLQQKSGFFRKTPRWLDKLLDSPKLLSWVGRKAGMTSAKDLGQTTISMLRGERGLQIKELNRLLEWLDTQEHKPDIVCLSNILLAGLAKSIKQRLGVPIVCLLQDEDEFLDGLQSPYSEQAWQIISERTGDIDVFIAVSKYYADVMRKRLKLPEEKMHVVYTGISLDDYKSQLSKPEVPTIGFLSRMCSDKGLDVLVDAFIDLKKKAQLKNARLRITGGKRTDDEIFLDGIKQKLSSHNLINDVEFLHEFDKDAKLAFLRTISVLSVPETQPVAYGLYVIEALASGVPMVEPASGVFNELIEITGGGLLYEPNNKASLTAALESLLLKPDYAQKLGKNGQKAVFEKFNIEQTATEIMRIYGEVTQ